MSDATAVQQGTGNAGRSRWLQHLYRAKSQIALSAAFGLVVAAIAGAVVADADYTPFESRGAYLAFMLGIASVLALVASITFGFLLHSFQSLTSERNLLYGRFKDAAKDLRLFLDGLYDDGTIEGSYDYAFGLVEEVTLKDFPLLGDGWTERIDPLVENVTEEQREGIEAGGGDFGMVLRGFAYRLNDMEEAVHGLTYNWIGSLLMERLLDAVVKAFRTLAAVLLVVILAAVYYDGLLETWLWAAGLGLAMMTLLLVLEITMIARRESGGIYPEIGEDEEPEAEDEETEDVEEASEAW